MNLSKLFEIQRKLDDHIEREHPRQPGEERLAKKILALQVELGELANEWRGFKFWSEDQKARTYYKRDCRACKGFGFIVGEDDSCFYCNGTGYEKQKNPLLEEYVDCLHFILSIGLEIQIETKTLENFIISKKMPSVLDQFMWTNNKINSLYKTHRDEGKPYTAYDYIHAFNAVIGLGELLGFTWEQIEQAYLEKNKTNHERQENGY